MGDGGEKEVGEGGGDEGEREEKVAREQQRLCHRGGARIPREETAVVDLGQG